MVLTRGEIKKIIVDEIDKLNLKRYRETEDAPYFLSSFVWVNGLEECNIKDKYSFANFLAASFDPMCTTEEEVRDRVYNLYDYYDDSDLIYWGGDDD